MVMMKSQDEIMAQYRVADVLIAIVAETKGNGGGD